MEENINVQNKKVILFFQSNLDEDKNVMKYHNYVNIFKMKVFSEKEIDSFVKRKPLFAEAWPETMQNNYKKLIRRLINLNYQQYEEKQNFMKIIRQNRKEVDYEELIRTVFDDAKIHKDKMSNILGESG